MTDRGALTVHTTHIPPGSSNGCIKVQVLEAVLLVVSESPRPCILCGDFNAPQAETLNGRIVTWAERVREGAEPRLRVRFRGDDGQRWHDAEMNVIQGGRRRELLDAYRTLHGYGREDFSWYLKRGDTRVGRRFDHAFCSPDVRVRRCEYLHGFREEGLARRYLFLDGQWKDHRMFARTSDDGGP